MYSKIILAEPASDRHISRAIALQILLVSVKNILVQAFPDLLEQNDVLNLVVLGTVAVFYVHAFLTLGARMLRVGGMCMGLLAFLLIVWSLSFMAYPQNSTEIIALLPRFMTYCLLTAFLITRLTSLRWLAHYMKLFSYGITLTALVSTLYILSVGHSSFSDWSVYSMPLSTYTLISTMWHYYQFFETKRIVPLGFAIVGTLVIVLVGSRNPLLAILVYVLVSILRHLFDRKQTFLVRLAALACCSIAAFLAFFWRRVVSLIYRLLYAFGIHSRTLYLLMQEEISDSGRNEIHAKLIAYMNEHPLRPLGVAGDRIPLDGEWAHGLYFSILATFGYVLGAVVLILLAVMCIKALRRSRGVAREMLILYMCIVLPRGFVAVDVWQNDVFWWMLAIMITVLDPVLRKSAAAVQERAAEPPSAEEPKTVQK